jgi:Acyl-coenzyme A:6-aminopenicillanic acid acyl-transferase
MDTHSFQEAECEGGRLYYRNDVPILELTEDPAQTGEQFGYLSGKAHGYLLGSHIYELKKSLHTIIHNIMLQPRALKIKTLLDTVRQQIPDSYQLEIAGLSDGYNKWARQSHVETNLTPDEILLIHLIADSKHFHTKVASDALKEKVRQAAQAFAGDLAGGMACTTLLHRDQETGVEFGRNMDWLPFGTGGAKSLVIVWKALGVAALDVPGIIGAITGWNKHNLAAAMNVCPGETGEVRGMPGCLFNRYLLENAGSVADVKELIEGNRPLGPYLLTIADKQDEAARISFYQGEDEEDYVRDLTVNNDPLITVNWRYPACEGGYFDSKGRTEKLTRFFKKAAASIPAPEQDWSLLIENGLKLTNSWITIHSLRFQPKADRVFLNTDNGYAASATKKDIRMSEVF